MTHPQPNPPEKVESLTREERAAWLEAHYAPNPEDAQCEIDALRMQLIQERARILALEAQVAGMQQRLDRLEPKPHCPPGVVLPSNPVVGDARCNKVIAGQGRAYPRTCMVCGLGPCRADQIAYSLLVKSVNATTDAVINDARKARLAAAKEPS